MCLILSADSKIPIHLCVEAVCQVLLFSLYHFFSIHSFNFPKLADADYNEEITVTRRHIRVLALCTVPLCCGP